jgi:alanine-synthesizing transaminase
LNGLELIADTYLSVSAPVQWAAAELLESRGDIQTQILARARRNLALLRSRICADSPWSVLDVEAGWYAVIQAPKIRTEEEWVLTLLDQNNVLVQPGFFYDFESEAYLVLSLLTPPETFAVGVERILGRA